MALRNEIANTLMVIRLIERALYDDGNWAFEIDGRVSPAAVVEHESGVLFRARAWDCVPGEHGITLLLDGVPVLYKRVHLAGDAVDLEWALELSVPVAA